MTSYRYEHDEYGNDPYITDNPLGEWADLKELGGEWAEIGDLHERLDGFYNNRGEIVFSEIEMAAEGEFGTAEFGGVEYTLAEQATADNFGTEGLIRYYAKATSPDGDTVMFAWNTTECWDLAEERAKLESESNPTPEQEERLSALDGMVLPDVSDESNACDWDSPFSVTVI